ncbi:hypothetical protein [Paenibacillus amylolyticus]|uniref:hypothetical protein n=1 Tax=Paenibacillus amylolyticus TaxID=1451 RepID=UPI00339AACC9
MINVEDKELDVQLNDYNQYHIGYNYGIEASDEFENDLNRNFELGMYLYNNNFISKRKMIDDIVIQALFKGTRFENCSNFEAVLEMNNYDRQEVSIQMLIDAPELEITGPGFIPPVSLRCISNQDIFYIRNAMVVENKYMNNKQYHLHRVSLDEVLPYGLLKPKSTLFYGYEDNTLYIVSEVEIECPWDIKKTSENEYVDYLRLLKYGSDMEAEKRTSIEVRTDVYDYQVEIEADHVSSIEWFIFSRSKMAQATVWDDDGSKIDIEIYDNFKDIILPICYAGEFISSKDRINGNQLSSDCDTWGTAMNARAYTSYVFYIEDQEKYGVVTHSYYVY